MNTRQNRRILLVDDMPTIHEDFRKILAHSAATSELDEDEARLFGTPARTACVGFELDSAHQGAQALDKVRASLLADRPYAMAFVDMRMPPGWDGVETIERLWQEDPAVQIVLCTAYSDYSWTDVLSRLDVRDRLLILKKPFDAIEVLQMANALTEKWQMTQQAALKMTVLEEAVRERTAELTRANEVLQEDIVERKRAEQELRDSEQRYVALFDSGPVPMWVYDIATRQFLAVNHAATQSYGYSAEEFLSITIFDIRPEAENDRLQQYLAEAVLDQKGCWQHRRKDGSVFPVTIVSQSIAYAGRAARFVVALDITAQVNAEKDVQDYLLTLQRAADAAQAITWHQTLQGTLQEIAQQVRGVIGAHQAVVSLTHDGDWAQAINALSLSEKYAQYRDLIEPMDGSGIHALVCETNRPLRMTQAELEAHPRWRGFGHYAGKHPAMRGWMAVPLTDRDGKNVGLLQLSDKYEGEFTQTDEYVALELAQLASSAIENSRLIEEVNRLNTGLEQKVAERTAALCVSNQELEAFSYSVSHDLRSPLNTIDGFSQLLARQLAESESEKVQHYLSRIRAGTAQMGQLIGDLLSLAQVARAQLRSEPVDLSALSRSILDDLQASQPERQVALHVETGLQVRGDAGLLRVTLENLLGNAWKYSSKQAEAEISVGQQLDAAGEPVFFVRDNGAGFDMAYADKLFLPFQRLHVVAEFPGAGIGLATVSRVIGRHGGRIWADAAPGRGATFFFTLSPVK